jgi:nucleotide-binding universal stress UspA family protein
MNALNQMSQMLQSSSPPNKHLHIHESLYRSVLVPLDGSETAEGALPYAAELSSKLGAQITLLRVVPSFVKVKHETTRSSLSLHSLDLSNDIARKQFTAQRDAAFRYLRSVSERFWAQRLPFTFEVFEGGPREGIVRFARDHEIDLILMTSRRRNSLARLLSSTVAESVQHEAPCPVLIIPRQR